MAEGNPSDSTTALLIEAYVRELERAINAERLASYASPDDRALTTITNYFWNTLLCKELVLSLGMVEVTLRNAIHDTLTIAYGTPEWYDIVGLLQKRESMAILRAKTELRTARKQTTPGRVVAALSFGFWTGLLSAAYGDSPTGTPIWTPNNAELIKAAFPHLAPSHQGRGYVHRRFNAIRLLRNRVSHHEPIWSGLRLQSGQTISLGQIHEDILDAIGWTNPTVKAYIIAVDRFPAALVNGRGAIESEIMGFLTSR